MRFARLTAQQAFTSVSRPRSPKGWRSDIWLAPLISQMRRGLIWPALVLSIAGCGGSSETSTTTWTLRVEVTSWGKNVAFTGPVHASSAPFTPGPSAPSGPTTEIAIGGSTPFSQAVRVIVGECDSLCTRSFAVKATKSSDGPEILTLCVHIDGTGQRKCAPPCFLGCEPNGVSVSFLI